MKLSILCPTVVSTSWFIRGSGKLSFGQDLFKSVKPAYIHRFLFDFLTKMTLDNQLTYVVSLNLVASKQSTFKVNGEVLFYVESLPLLFD